MNRYLKEEIDTIRWCHLRHLHSMKLQKVIQEYKRKFGFFVDGYFRPLHYIEKRKPAYREYWLISGTTHSGVGKRKSENYHRDSEYRTYISERHICRFDKMELLFKCTTCRSMICECKLVPLNYFYTYPTKESLISFINSESQK